MRIRDILSGLKVKDIAGADQWHIIIVSAQTAIIDAAHILTKKKIGLLVVCDDKGGLVGVLSERDVVHAIAAHGKDAVDMTVDAFMTRDVEVCSLEDPPYKVMSRMSAGGFRHMPVMEGQTLKGVISSRDIIKYYADSGSSDQLVKLLKEVSWV